MHSNSVALLPAGKINLRDHTAYEYYDKGQTLLVLRSSRTGGLTTATTFGSASEKVGDAFEAHHDQAGYSFGLLTVVGIWDFTTGVRVGNIPARTLNNRVFK